MPTSTTATPTETFYRVDDFIAHLREVCGLQISKSAFLTGVKTGKFPQPVRPSPKRPVWKTSDIAALIAVL